jgi:hypothetical protein
VVCNDSTIVVPDFGFYGREGHVSVIRENRLVAGVNSLGELPPKLRQSVLLIKDKEAAGATVEDAETLAKYARAGDCWVRGLCPGCHCLSLGAGIVKEVSTIKRGDSVTKTTEDAHSLKGY